MAYLLRAVAYVRWWRWPPILLQLWWSSQSCSCLWTRACDMPAHWAALARCNVRLVRRNGREWTVFWDHVPFVAFACADDMAASRATLAAGPDIVCGVCVSTCTCTCADDVVAFRAAFAAGSVIMCVCVSVCMCRWRFQERKKQTNMQEISQRWPWKARGYRRWISVCMCGCARVPPARVDWRNLFGAKWICRVLFCKVIWVFMRKCKSAHGFACVRVGRECTHAGGGIELYGGMHCVYLGLPQRVYAKSATRNNSQCCFCAMKNACVS